MADLLIKGIRELTGPHTIHVSNVGLNGVKDGFKAWDSAVGCAYEVVEVPAHGRLIDADELAHSYADSGQYTTDQLYMILRRIISSPTVIEASEE